MALSVAGYAPCDGELLLGEFRVTTQLTASQLSMASSANQLQTRYGSANRSRLAELRGDLQAPGVQKGIDAVMAHHHPVVTADITQCVHQSEFVSRGSGKAINVQAFEDVRSA